MENVVRNILENDLIVSLEVIISYLDKANLSEEQLAKLMANMPELSREGIYITALSNENKELADKIEKANELIKQNRISTFKQSVIDGKWEEFLANMHWVDKAFLSVDMGLYDKKDLTKVDQLYFSIIDKSIKDDIEKESPRNKKREELTNMPSSYKM